MSSMQFKITLCDIQPEVWRRILVPENYSFWDLHVAIQDAFGWSDCHLHMFNIKIENKNISIGIPDPDFNDMGTKPGWEIEIKKYIIKKEMKIRYIYDFGDDWMHEVIYEENNEKEIIKPILLGGERACPPEDVGGIGGYERFCEIMKKKKGIEYKEMKEWYGKEYNPEAFDMKQVAFDNPKKRLKQMQGN